MLCPAGAGHPSIFYPKDQTPRGGVSKPQSVIPRPPPPRDITDICLSVHLSVCPPDCLSLCLSARVACSESAALRSCVMLQLHVDRQVDTRGTQTGRQTHSRDRRVVSVSWSYLVVTVRPSVRLPVRCLSASPCFSRLPLSKRGRGVSAAGACWERKLLLSW